VGINKKLSIKSDDESSLVDKRFEISNHDLITDIIELTRFEEIVLANPQEYHN
jgi:hypothetical protein